MSDATDKAVVETVPTTPDGLQAVKQAQEIDVKDIDKIVGRYTVLWRKDSKQIAKVEEIKGDEFIYMMVTGPDKGKRFQAKHFAKTIKVYDEDNLVLATVE
jgi:hypothetical protein